MVLLLLCQARIDHILDTGDRDGRFGDVSRQDDLARLGRGEGEGFGLFGGREAGVERADKDLRSRDQCS